LYYTQVFVSVIRRTRREKAAFQFMLLRQLDHVPSQEMLQSPVDGTDPAIHANAGTMVHV
jgi:hypothetical protein